MKYLDEYRSAPAVKKLAGLINQTTKSEWKIMEICGGQTHSIVKNGIEEIITDKIKLVHGPGCPVCVTPAEKIDAAVEIALRPGVIFCSYGDMLRVPGRKKDLLSAKALGADVRIIYSPLDALKIAEENPDKEIVFFAIGFETTAPANASSVFQAHSKNIKNFSVISSHFLVPPAIKFILESGINTVNGFLAAGHVCTIMGTEDYEKISVNYKVPVVITGFEPVDILTGIYNCVILLENNQPKVENSYSRVVRQEGNIRAKKLMFYIFETSDMYWRGIGLIKNSGLALKEKFSAFDAEKKFNVEIRYETNSDALQKCISGLIMQGLKKPSECEHFGTLCTPEHPLGPTMVSSEGACSAYFKYKKINFNN